MPAPVLPWQLLKAISALADAPLLNIADRLRDATQPFIASDALVIFTEDCTGRPQKKAGDEEIISRVSIAELEAIRSTLSDDMPWRGEAEIAGRSRPVLACVHSPSRALLILADPRFSDDDDALDAVVYLWGIAARRIQEKVADAPPSFLLESRATSAERVRVTAELTDMHSTALETFLAILRSSSLDDATARATVTDLTAKALIRLRALNDRTTDMVEEPVAKAFERLKEDLLPLTRFSGIQVEFIEPPLDGRALPGEVAHAARAIVRGFVLAMTEQPEISKVRTQWDCDGKNLLINIRDNGAGTLSPDSPSISRLDSRVQALSGDLQVDVMPGWGADIVVTLPLDPPARPADGVAVWNLAERELEVLQQLSAGKSNRSISSMLGISENTVKFHVRNIFRKLDVRSRAEAIALAHSRSLR